MKKTNLKKINRNNIIDLMCEPSIMYVDEDGRVKHRARYSVIERNGTRKEITRAEFYQLLMPGWVFER